MGDRGKCQFDNLRRLRFKGKWKVSLVGLRGLGGRRTPVTSVPGPDITRVSQNQSTTSCHCLVRVTSKVRFPL